MSDEFHLFVGDGAEKNSLSIVQEYKLETLHLLILRGKNLY